MKQLLGAPIAIALCMVFASAQDKTALKDQRDKASYTIGTKIGGDLKEQKLDLNTEALAAGIKDALGNKQLQLTEAEMREALMNLQKEMMEKMAKQGEENRKKGEEFLAANKSKAGVKTLDSGLQYKVLKEGTGPKPAKSDTVKCDYKGTLIDGFEFDSSYKRGEAATFPISGVIPGWTEALQLMPVGSKWQLFIPSDLAYGERGPSSIPPNSTLIFEVELHSIEKAEK